MKQKQKQYEKLLNLINEHTLSWKLSSLCAREQKHTLTHTRKKFHNSENCMHATSYDKVLCYYYYFFKKKSL